MPRKKGRANGEGSIYEYPKGSGRWVAQITLADGRTKRKRAGSQAEARECLKELNALRDQGVKLSAKQPTVAEWCVIWLEKYSKQLKPNIRDDYRGVVRRYIDTDPIGRRKLHLLTPAEVQDWVDRLCVRVSERTKKPLDAQTIHNAHARLHKAMAEAVKRRYRADNPADDTEMPPIRAEQIHPLDFEQTCLLLETVADHRWAVLYRLAVNLGLREGELLGLTWDAINLEKGAIHVYRQLKRVRAVAGGAKTFLLQTTKTPASDRVLDLDADLVALLRAHRKNQMEERLISGKRWKDTMGLVFVTETGAPIHSSNLLKHFRNVLGAAGLPQIRFHDLRHTAATLMLDENVPIVTVSKILGHSSPAVTAKIYAHALDKSKAGAIAGLSQRLRRVK